MITLLHRGYKYRIYPTEEQKHYFMQTFGCRRKVYNLYDDALYQQLEASGYQNGYIRKRDLCFITPAAMKTQYPFLRDVDSLALCNAQLAFQRAITKFNEEYDKKSYTKRSMKRRRTLGIEPTFRDLKGMPHFKSAKNGDFSYTTNNQSNDGKWNNIFYPSSKLCHCCGCINDALDLGQGSWICACGAEHYRDHNAAINIREAGKSLLGVA